MADGFVKKSYAKSMRDILSLVINPSANIEHDLYLLKGKQRGRVDLESEIKRQIPCYERIIKLTNFLMRCCSIDLIYERPQSTGIFEGGLDPMRCVEMQSKPDPQHVTQTTDDGQLREKIEIRLFGQRQASAIACQSIVILVAIKIIYDNYHGIAFSFFHDQSMQNLRNEITPKDYGHTHTNSSLLSRHLNCSLWPKLSKNYHNRFHQTLEWSLRLNEIGVVGRSSLGTYFLGVAVIALSPFVFYIWPSIYFLAERVGVSACIRCNALASMLQPNISLEFLREQIDGIVAQLKDCIFNGSSAMLHRSFHKRTNCARSIGGAPRCVSPYQVGRFFKLVKSIEDEFPSSTLPYLAHSQWRIDFMRLFNFILIAFVVISAGCPTLSMILLHTTEMWRRSESRLLDMRCKYLLGPDAITTEPIILGLVSLNEKDAQMYRKYFASTLNSNHSLIQHDLPHSMSPSTIFLRAYLAFGIETRYAFNVAAIVRWLELQITICLLSFCSSLWTVIYIAEFIQNVTLLQEVKLQLIGCVECIAQLSSNNYHRTKNELAITFDRHLLGAYVKYELVRRRLTNFHRLTQFLVIQAASLAAGTFYALYLVVTRIDASQKPYLMFASVCVLLYLNIYLFTASFTPKLIGSIMFQLVRLLAGISSERSMRWHATLVTVWRRQLIDEKEIERYSAASLFGFKISYRELLAVNLNLVGIYLLMWRVFSDQ